MATTPDEIAFSDLPDDSTVWERRMKSLTMRNAGATYPRIAEQMGVSEKQSRLDVRRAIQEIVQIPVDQMVERQRAILLDLTRVNYPAALAGDKDAQGVLLRILEHEAKLYGLYAPTRVNVGISEREFGEQAAELLAALGTEPLRELAGYVDAEVVAAEPDEVEEPWSNLG